LQSSTAYDSGLGRCMAQLLAA